MMKYGHNENFRRVILRRVIARYEDSLSNHLEARNNLYKTKAEREIQKRVDIMNQKDTWFCNGGATSTLQVPPTPGRQLMVEKNLERSRRAVRTKTKVVEGVRVSACQGLVKSNQFPRRLCTRTNYLLCVHKDGRTFTKCDRSNI